jgi:hypothetical protein
MTPLYRMLFSNAEQHSGYAMSSRRHSEGSAVLKDDRDHVYAGLVRRVLKPARDLVGGAGDAGRVR